MSGYKSRDESSQGPQGSRTKKHLKEIIKCLQKCFPACNRGVVRAGKESLRCAERQKERYKMNISKGVEQYHYHTLEGRKHHHLNLTLKTVYFCLSQILIFTSAEVM